jgi:hypothetical protein
MDFEASIRRHAVGAFALSSFLVGIGAAPAGAQAVQKPNIVVIMSDDVGWLSISAYNQGIMAGHTHCGANPLGRDFPYRPAP